MKRGAFSGSRIVVVTRSLGSCRLRSTYSVAIRSHTYRGGGSPSSLSLSFSLWIICNTIISGSLITSVDGAVYPRRASSFGKENAHLGRSYWRRDANAVGPLPPAAPIDEVRAKFTVDGTPTQFYGAFTRPTRSRAKSPVTFSFHIRWRAKSIRRGLNNYRVARVCTRTIWRGD